MIKLWAWFKAKFGRVVTGAGIVLSGVEDFNINPIREPLEGFFGPTYGHRIVMGLIVVLFVASYFRHQYTASKNPKPDILPPPVTK